MGVPVRCATSPKTGNARSAASPLAERMLGVVFALMYFPDEFSWSLEVSGIMLLWVGALGASICAYAGKHIRLDALQKTVPD